MFAESRKGFMCILNKAQAGKKGEQQPRNFVSCERKHKLDMNLIFQEKVEVIIFKGKLLFSYID